MGKDRNQHSDKTPAKQGSEEVTPKPNTIGASTPFDCNGKNLTAYGGLVPVATRLEKLGFQSLVEQMVTCERIPRAMDRYRFALGIVLGRYLGFPRLNPLRFIARDPILTGILQVGKLPAVETRTCSFCIPSRSWILHEKHQHSSSSHDNRDKTYQRAGGFIHDRFEGDREVHRNAVRDTKQRLLRLDKR